MDEKDQEEPEVCKGEHPVTKGREAEKVGRKPLFEMCWFYMGIVQIALDPPPFCKTGKCGIKVLQTILASA